MDEAEDKKSQDPMEVAEEQQQPQDPNAPPTDRPMIFIWTDEGGEVQFGANFRASFNILRLTLEVAVAKLALLNQQHAEVQAMQQRPNAGIILPGMH